MTDEPDTSDAATPDPDGSETSDDVHAVRVLLADANRRLLGDTIAVDDEAWRAPSRLPNWTRGHVATHIARNADALARLGVWVRTGERQEMYPHPRDPEIEAQAGRSGLELQTDLDTSAELLDEEFERIAEVDAWDNEFEHRGGARLPGRALPLMRLAEVVIHHVDLGVGYELTDIDAATAEQCLRLCTVRLSQRDDYPALKLITESGGMFTINDHDRQVSTVRGPANLLLGWVTHRGPTDGLTGDLIELPSFG